MKLYRLVNQAHDPTAVGQFLVRTSTHSNQKMGDGMYFGLDVFEALRFNATRNHTYTHLLEVDVTHAVADFFDLRANENAVVKSPFASEKVAERFLSFCNHHGKKGLIWSSKGTGAWTEVLVLAPYVPAAGFAITDRAPV
jgi:hypothetical protein